MGKVLVYVSGRLHIRQVCHHHPCSRLACMEVGTLSASTSLITRLRRAGLEYDVQEPMLTSYLVMGELNAICRTRAPGREWWSFRDIEY